MADQVSRRHNFMVFGEDCRVEKHLKKDRSVPSLTRSSSFLCKSRTQQVKPSKWVSKLRNHYLGSNLATRFLTNCSEPAADSGMRKIEIPLGTTQGMV